jgi:hypothetical protein
MAATRISERPSFLAEADTLFQDCLRIRQWGYFKLGDRIAQQLSQRWRERPWVALLAWKLIVLELMKDEKIKKGRSSTCCNHTSVWHRVNKSSRQDLL